MAREEEEETPEMRAKEMLMKRDPEYAKREVLAEKMRKKEVLRQTSFDVGETGVQPHLTSKIANIPQATIGREEEALVDRINQLLDKAKDAEPGDIELTKEINEVIMESEFLEQKTGAIHRQALERINDRFYSRVLPLSQELRRLYEL